MTTPPVADSPEVAALRGYLRAPADDTLVCQAWEEATALVTHTTTGATIPATVLNLATREVAADLYHRRRVRNGIANFDGADLTPIRVTRDPMKAAEDILRPFLPGGIA